MKTLTPFARAPALLLALACALSVSPAASAGKGREKNITLTPVGTYSAKVFNQAAAEIVAHDPATQRLFSIGVTPYGDQANSVAVRDGVVAAAVQADTKTDLGKVVFFDASGSYLDDSIEIPTESDAPFGSA